MNKELLQCPAVIDGIRTLVDRGLKITLDLPELVPEDVATLISLRNQEGYFVFKPSRIIEEDIISLPEEPVEKFAKNKSLAKGNIMFCFFYGNKVEAKEILIIIIRKKWKQLLILLKRNWNQMIVNILKISNCRIAVRDYKIKECLKNKEDLDIRHKGKQMIIKYGDLKSKILKVSDEIYNDGQDYQLYFYRWNPLSNDQITKSLYFGY